MAFRATQVALNPLDYFLQSDMEYQRLRVSDILLRTNLDPREIFSQLIRLATNSHWSHNALLYLLNDPVQGFDNTFLVEAMTTGVRVASLRNEIEPPEQFNVGIRRLLLDWYIETPQEVAQHNTSDLEDTHGIAFLRHVRGMAVDQINGLYSHNVVNELASLYIERISKRYHVPLVGALADDFARLFEKWDESPESIQTVTRFICSGLVQYSYFAALRRRIINAMDGARDVAMSNLSNMQHIIFRPDPEGIVPDYIQQVQTGKLKLSDALPVQVSNFLKTTTPADFNNSTNLAWCYIIFKGTVWQIEDAPDTYMPKSDDEKHILAIIAPEHRG